MKTIANVAALFGLVLTHTAHAESLRCKGDIVEVGDSKIDIFRKCGEPYFKDTYCENKPFRVKQKDGTFNIIEHCENVDVWTYNPGKGQFWTNLYFTEGKLREMKYGDRVETQSE
jgi:hypothetical protein